MSFRNKLTIAFSSILLLTILVTIVGWLGMETALRRQAAIFSFSLEIDQLLDALSQEQHAFILSQENGQAIRIRQLLDELDATVHSSKDVTAITDPANRSSVVISHLNSYKETFQKYTQALLDSQTMQSRMLRESDRLFSTARNLLAADNALRFSIMEELGIMLLAEKNYTLSRTEQVGARVLQAIDRIQLLAGTLQNSVPSDQGLKAFRVSKSASLYRMIFENYLEEQSQLQQTLEELNSSRATLALELRHYTDEEFAATQRHVERLKMLTLVISFVVVILFFLLTTLLSSRITRPINRLKNSAADILKGDLTTRVPIDSNDEIGQLAQIFNQMTRKLQQGFEELESYRDHLQELVNSRTAELEKEVSDRRQAEENLRSSEEQLRLIVDQSPMGIIFWNTDFRVQRWNIAAQKIFGYTAEEAADMHASNLLPVEMHRHMRKIWTKLEGTSKGVRSRNENITKDGGRIQCDWFNTPVTDSSGQVLGALSLVENVTEQMRLDRELRKLEKLESTGILAGGIAHDFNNILTGILGNINLAQLTEKLPEKSKELLSAAEKAAIRAKALTQQLLTFAKGGEPIKEATSLAEVIYDSASFVLHGGTVSGIFNISDDLWHALVDRNQFSQVIQNIVLNARHAMPQGGSVVIRGENIDLGKDSFPLLDKEKRYIRISIKDNGIGIPAAVLDKIFDPYFSTKQEGSGLGLAITLSIIRKHDGHIQVLSEPGSGTEFIIYLPATDNHTAPAALLAAEDQAQQRKVNILVMEDDLVVQDVLNSMLQELGHQTTITASGEEAISIYRETFSTGSPFDLVIVDLTIPGGIGGKETCEKIREINEQAAVIVSSGYSNDPIMANFKQYGFVAAMSKPYVMEELKRVLALATAS